MKIKMTGIDFNKAEIEYREEFALTKAKQARFLESIQKNFNILGCVIINTCNRMELWISCDKNIDADPYEILCNLYQVDLQEYKDYFTKREDLEAIIHLFELACGLRSKVFGEEQILSQVKE